VVYLQDLKGRRSYRRERRERPEKKGKIQKILKKGIAGGGGCPTGGQRKWRRRGAPRTRKNRDQKKKGMKDRGGKKGKRYPPQGRNRNTNVGRLAVRERDDWTEKE